MKSSILTIFLLLIFSKSFSQTRPIFIASDRFGNQYAISRLNINSPLPLDNNQSLPAPPAGSCTSGYFIAYYASGSIWDNNPAAQAVLCQVLWDVSNFLGSSLSLNPNTGPKIRLYCSNTPTNIPGTLGAASAFYVFPGNAYNPNQGLIDNQIYKMIISGIDSYSNVPISYVNGNSFYHGLVYANPTPPGGGTWNTTLTNTTVSSSEFCMYSMLLHEITHALGFNSLISSNGNSVFGSGNNFYSRFDKFLVDANGTSLITTTTAPTCPTSSLVFTSSLTSVIASATSGCITNTTTCSAAVQYSSTNVNVPVYTPNCFEPGSSLSHFEDICPISTTVNCATSTNSPLNNDKYYALSNASGMGACYVKRSLKDEERSVLCDLGYTVSSVYGTTVAGSNYTYTGACTPTNVWGLNDGLLNGSYIYTASLSFTTQIPVPIPQVLQNDSPNTNSLSCLELVSSPLNVTAVIVGTNIIISSPNNTAGPVILKYLPKDAAGNFGGPTYIFAYFYSANCPNVNPCELVQNGGFESSTSIIACGDMQAGVNVNCWEAFANFPAYFVRSCNASGGIFELGANTWSLTSPAVDSYNGPPNDAIIGLSAYPDGHQYYVIESQLSGSLAPTQSYQISLWAYNPSTVIPVANNTISPVVLSIYSTPNIGFLGPPTLLTEFTVNPTSSWINLTNTVVFTPTVGHASIRVQISPSSTVFLAPISPNTVFYTSFIDDISIVPIPSPSFSIPNANICGNTTFTDLAQYASITGTFSGTGVTLSGSQYDFNLTGTLSPGSYPVAFTYSLSSGCTKTLWQSVVISPAITLSVTGTASACPYVSQDPDLSQGSVFLVASSSCTNCTSSSYYWEPGYVLGSTATFSPGINSIYTLNVISGSCVATQTFVPISLAADCCTTTSIPTYTGTLVTGSPAFSGPTRFANSFTIQSGSQLYLSGEFIVDPGVKITVSPSSTLNLWGAHLYGCGALWEGVEILDGGIVYTYSHSGNDNLIEDTETAFWVNNYTGNTTSTILNFSNIIFNKNYVDISFSNYPISSNSYSLPIKLDNCIFTCRDLTFTPTSWPNTSTSGLRSASSSTNPLASPYLLQNTPLATLKSPHTGEYSHIAIKLNGVGLTYENGSAPHIFQHIDLSPANGFNLYDSHNYFIKSTNSNVRITNSVFQNTQTFSVASTPTIGAAVDYSCTTLNTYTPNTHITNYELDMSAPSTSLANKFFDCHRAVYGNNAFSFKFQHAIVRSTHLGSDVTNTLIVPNGQTGIFMRTNQVEDYIIENNEFSNVTDGVAISLYYNSVLRHGLPYYVGLPYNVFLGATYINTLSISNNTFSPEDNTNFSAAPSGYVKNAITVNGDQINGTMSRCGCAGIHIENNEIYRALNGILLNSVNPMTLTCRNNSPKKIIKENTIVLEEDTYFGGITQHGISFTQSYSEPMSNGQRLQTVEDNTLSVYGGSAAMSNQNISLYYGALNGGAGQLYPTPHILCNYLSNANKGFVFENENKPASWRGNKMEDLTKGLVFTGTSTNGGIIGQQGDASNPSDNEWNLSWGTTNAGTWVDLGSDGNNSPLYIRSSTGQWIPQNNAGGGAAPSQLYSIPNNNLSVSSSGSFDCSTKGNYALMNVPPPPTGTVSNVPWYLSAAFAYRYLALNDSMKHSDGDLLTFYDALAGTSIDYFMQVEMNINQREFSAAQAVLNSMDQSSFHEVETSQYSYYTLSLKYKIADPDLVFSAEDLNTLKSLADLCPGSYGSVVYQSRALYQLITGQVYNGSDGCAESNARMAKQTEKQLAEKKEQKWDVNLFPNPNNGNFAVISKNEKEILEISINDLAGKELYKKQVQTSKHYYVLDVTLMNGVYFVTIKNKENESVTKKMGIAK